MLRQKHYSVKKPLLVKYKFWNIHSSRHEFSSFYLIMFTRVKVT